MHIAAPVVVRSSFWLQYRASGCGIGVSVVVGTISPLPPPSMVYGAGCPPLVWGGCGGGLVFWVLLKLLIFGFRVLG